MANEEYLFVVLGCFGRRDDTFVSCGAVENRILLVNSSLEYYNEIMDYLENVRLFDRPMFDANAIRHFIYYIQEKFPQGYRPMWEVKQFRLFEKFIIDHKMCGTYIKLLVTDTLEDSNIELESKSVYIRSEEKTEKPQNNPNLKLIRGRRT